MVCAVLATESRFSMPKRLCFVSFHPLALAARAVNAAYMHLVLC